MSTDSTNPTLMRVKTRKVDWDPRFLVAAINPRDLSDLQGQGLMPAIEKTSGVITKAVVIWKPIDAEGEFDPDHPIWDRCFHPVTNEKVVIPREERHKYRIIDQGHRRIWCAVTALDNPEKYSAEMLRNLAKVPALEIACSQEEAEEIALDFEDSEPLHSWNTVKLVLDYLRRDYRYQDIAVKMPRLLFGALLQKGEAKYNKVVREAKSGSDRISTLVKMLRNRLDTHIVSCHILGPAMADQLILHWRYNENGLEDAGDQDRLVINLKYTNVQQMRQAYNEIVKDGGEWTPITRIEIVPEKPAKADDRDFAATPSGIDKSGQWFVVEGGNADFRQRLLRAMHVYQKPEDDVTEEDKPPTKPERKPVIAATHSGYGKALCGFFDRSSKDEVSGKFLRSDRTRAQWEEWALFSESTQARLLELAEGSEPLVKELIVAMTSQSAPKTAAERVATAITTLNEALKAPAPKSSKARGRR